MKKRTTISRQMAFRSGMLSAISVLIVIIVSIFILRENLIRDNNERLILEAQTYQDEIENWIDNIVEPMNIVVQTIRKTDIKDDNEKLLNYLKDVTLGFNEAIPEGMYVANSDNELIDPTGFILDSDIIIAEREWFALGLTSENLVLGDPYYGVNLDIGAMVSASARIDEKTVACMDIVLTSIVEKVKTIDVIGDGYSFLLDKSTGYILAHPNSEYSGKKIYEIEDEFILQAFAKASEAEENIYTLEDRGTSYLVKGNAIDDTDWMFFTCAQKAVIMDALSRAQVIYGIVAIVVTIASVIVIAMLIRITLKPVQDITRVVEKITTGDFSEKAVISGNNEITTLSEYLNTYIDQMRHTISRLFTISDYLKQQSENSEESSVAMLQSTSAQKDSMQQMNTTIDEMARSIEEVAESASALASKVSKINGNSNDATDKIINTVTDTENGKRDIEKLAVTITNIDGVMNELSVVVSEVGESMKAINTVTDIIGGIASQTNLLALNASIEAARAGEVGKGFAVVATEIGNLAAMCASSVNQIGSLVGKIQMQVEEVVTKTTVSAQDVALSRKLIDDTQKSFEKIYESINGTKELIADVTEKIMEVDEVTTAIAAITEEESAGAEEIVANSESLFEQAVLIEENSENVREVAQNLGAHAKEIYEQIAHFKL